MMRLLGLMATVCLVGIGTPDLAEAQAWTRNAGSGYLSLSYRSMAGDHFYGPDGDIRKLPSTYRQHGVSLYSEIGLVDRWLTASLDGELFRRNQLDDQGATSGMGDLRVSLWSGLLQAPFHLAVGLAVGLPTGDPDPDSGGDPFAEIIANSLPTGDGEVDVAFRIAVGHSFGDAPRWPLSHYVLGEAGYWLRTEEITDSVTYRLEIGTRVARQHWDRILLIGRLAGLAPLADGGTAGSFAGIGDGVSYLSYGAELAVRTVDTLQVSLGYETAASAQNAPAAAVLSVSLGWEF